MEDLHNKVRDGVSKLRGLNIGDELSVEILSNLIEGRMTVAEITERVYGLTNNDEGYSSCYSRIRRGIRRLESKGLVSRSLFGTNQPFRLTELAVINLAKIGGEEKQMKVVPRTDLVVYLATIVLALPVVFSALTLVEIAELSIISIFGCFCFLLGISFTRIVMSVRRVF